MRTKSTADCVTTTQQQQILLKIRKITNYITFHPQIALKLIDAGGAEDILQVQDLYIHGLNNSEDTTMYKANRIN